MCSGYNADFDGDTMSAYVPLTNEAVDEARKILPSRILFNPATARVMYTPSHEAQVGLYMKSEVGKKTRLKFKDEKELKAAIKAGKLTSSDAAIVGGVKTTLDRVEMDKALPKNLRGGKILTDLDYRFTKSEQNKMFGDMAKADKNGYAKNIDKMKDLGNLRATHGGFSFGLEDFKTHKDIRDPILNAASKKAKNLNLDKSEDMDKFIDIYEGAMNDMRSKLNAKAKNGKNPLDKLEVAAGIKGKGYVQLTAAPGLFVDAKGEVVPSPVKRNYSEGLSASDYWASASGGRKGVIQKVQSVSEPGYLTKLMMNSTLNTLVSKEDCETEKGISLGLDEPDIIGRYTTNPIKVGRTTIPENTLLTPEVINKIRNGKVSRVLVRSPMRCTLAKGVCKKCMGLNENGQLHDLGTNVGVLSAQAIGERGTQLAMKAFHCFANDSTVLAKVDGNVILTTMERLFNENSSMKSIDGIEEVIELPQDLIKIWDSSSWVDVTAIRRHAPTSPMVAVRSEDKIIIAQDNHRTATKGPDGRVEFVEPINMSEGTELFGDLSWCKDYGNEEMDLEFNPYMVGMYVAEGWIGYRWTNSNNRVKKPYSFGMKQKVGSIRDKLLSTIPVEWNPRQSGDTIEIHRLSLGSRFEELFGRYSRNVSLPPSFIHYSDKWLSDFLCGLIDGDGTITGDYIATYACVDTTSFELAQQLAVIARRLDIRSSIVLTTVRDISLNQGFRVTLWLTTGVKKLLSGSIKVASSNVTYEAHPISESTGFVPLSQVKPVIFKRICL